MPLNKGFYAARRGGPRLKTVVCGGVPTNFESWRGYEVSKASRLGGWFQKKKKTVGGGLCPCPV